MKQNKGFTLIELLAVIVILAIIALIATPIVLNMIASARKSAAKSSTLGYVDSIEYYAGFRQAESAGSIGINGYTVDVPIGTCVLGATSTTTDCTDFITAVSSKHKGEKPADGSYFTIAADGSVSAAVLTYNGYNCTYSGTNPGGTTCNNDSFTAPASAATVSGS